MPPDNLAVPVQIFVWTLAVTVAGGLISLGYYHPVRYRLLFIILSALLILATTAACFYYWGYGAAATTLLPYLRQDSLETAKVAVDRAFWLASPTPLVAGAIVTAGACFAALLDWTGFTHGNREERGRDQHRVRRPPPPKA